jgi:uncharacterized protein (TIGR02145 family)
MKRFAAVSLMVMMFLIVTGCVNDPKPEFGEMTDSRDGQTYKTVKLGDQTWLAHNLNYETDDGSWCYDDDPANCETFGRLYTWDAAMTACPDGWHLASDGEWSTLIKYLDRKADPSSITESSIAGGMLKATGTLEDGTGPWKSPNQGATDASGFSSEAGGARYEDGTYIVLGMHAIYWTSSEYDANLVWFRILDYGIADIYRDYNGITKGMGLSVRCMMD